MKKAGEGNIQTKVSRVLFNYRITPQSTTGLSPAEMLQGRRLRSTLDLVHPDLRSKVEQKQGVQKKHHDKQRTVRSFLIGDAVITQNFSYGPKWIQGFITKVTGPVSYKVMLGDGSIVRRHVDQILDRPEQKYIIDPEGTGPQTVPLVSADATPLSEEPGAVSVSGAPEGNPQLRDITTPSMVVIPETVREAPLVVPARTVSKPNFLKDYVCGK
ncbi:unnamed protein product [Knipowitschia caucasica]